MFVTNRDTEFTAYYAACGQSLRRMAYLLCGSWHGAEDLTQIVFIKLYRAWPRISRRDTMDAYLRKTLVRAFLDEQRRPWRRERNTEPEAPVFLAPTVSFDHADSLDLRQALDAIPPRQRAVLILRFWADLSVEQTAEALKCSPGTVKSQTAHGLDKLRKALTAREPSDV